MVTLNAAWALLDEGFVPGVRIRVDDAGRIAEVSRGADGGEALDVVLPGMSNLHSHGFQRVFAGLTNHSAAGGDFWTWRDAMYRAAARMTPELYAPVYAWLAKELLKGGYTWTAEFHYLHHQPGGAAYAPATAMAEAVAQGAARAGMGLTLLVGVYETAGFDAAPLGKGQLRFRNNAVGALNMAAALRARGGDGFAVGLALHSLRAVPAASLREAVAGFCAQGGGPIHIHAAEQVAEVEACRAALGAAPVEWLLDNAPVDAGWCLVHATQAEAEEIAGVARCGAVVGLCPSTEADLGDGLFDLPALQAGGGVFGIGSDSNVMTDAFSELRLLEYGQRLKLRRRNVAAGAGGHVGAAVWQAASRGGAVACGGGMGRIAVGCRADLVVLERQAEVLDGAPDFVLDAAIFAPVSRSVRHVMTGGVWRVRDGAHVAESAVNAAYAAALRRLKE
jgi:formimidoylglutamate deiminase